MFKGGMWKHYCVCVGGLKGHCTWLLLPLILFSCRPSPLLLFPTEGGDFSGSSLIPLSPLPLSPFSCLCCSIFPCIFPPAPFVTLPCRKSPLWWRGVCVRSFTRGMGIQAMWGSIAAEDIREYRFSHSGLNLVAKTCSGSNLSALQQMSPYQHLQLKNKGLLQQSHIKTILVPQKQFLKEPCLKNICNGKIPWMLKVLHGTTNECMKNPFECNINFWSWRIEQCFLVKQSPIICIYNFKTNHFAVYNTKPNHPAHRVLRSLGDVKRFHTEGLINKWVILTSLMSVFSLIYHCDFFFFFCILKWGPYYSWKPSVWDLYLTIHKISPHYRPELYVIWWATQVWSLLLDLLFI